jgi:hypothetical protein
VFINLYPCLRCAKAQAYYPGPRLIHAMPGAPRQPEDKQEGGKQLSKWQLAAVALVALLIPYVGWLIALGLLIHILRKA